VCYVRTMPTLDPVLAARYRALTLACPPPPGTPSRWLVVDVARQRLGVLEGGKLLGDYPVSTRATESSGKGTPPGWYRLRAHTGEEPLLALERPDAGVDQSPGGAFRGAVHMAHADILELFAQAREGDALGVVEAASEGPGLGRLHFAGVGGSGMSALAQYAAMQGGQASGSDRSYDQGRHGAARQRLERLGVRIFPQDGSGVSGDCCAVVYSTAVEESVPDFAQARRLGIPLLHRSELLAHFVAAKRTLAVTGTSGKSTTVAMVFEILRGAGRDPSVITGGELRALQGNDLWGNAWAGASDLLVVEADESDGSLVRYHPAVGVILNLQRDHKEMDVVAGMFRTFRDQTKEALVVGEALNLAEFHARGLVFGFGCRAGLRAEAVEERPQGCSFRVESVRFELSVPGRHNAENALAAIAACRAVGVPLEAMVAPLARFQGVARRFQVLGRQRGVEVVDDFGHNPAKVAASIRTAHARAGRVLAVFQPHGYGPTRFLRKDFVETFAAELAPQDRLWLLEVFYAGGTALRDFSAADIVEEIAARGAQAEFAPAREWLVERLAAEARNGDLVLVMGARDPSLTDLAQAVLDRLALG